MGFVSTDGAKRTTGEGDSSVDRETMNVNESLNRNTRLHTRLQAQTSRYTHVTG